MIGHAYSRAGDLPPGDANHTPPGRTADIIQLQPRLRGDASGVHPDSGEGRLAQIIQSLYADHGRTLTDPDTAEAHRIALAAAILILDGAHAAGDITAPAHAKVTRMMSAARAVPEYL